MIVSHHRYRLHAHHIYQLEIILLFAFGFFLLVPYYLLMRELNLDMTDAQWYFVLPWLIFYSIYCLRLRSKIPNNERIKPANRHIAHWVLLGILLIIYHLQPIDYEKMYSVDIMFMVFSVFLADSYWDFEKLKLFT